MIYFFFINFFISASFYLFPKISIIVPIYNVNLYLKECLNSIKNQTFKNIEIICVNDGSTDNSLEIIMEYIYDNRFIIIDKNNSGYGDSMNNGIEFTTGEYIGIVESDDFADFNMFENLYKYTSNGELDIVRSNFKLFWDVGKKKIDEFYFIKPYYNKIFKPIENPLIFLIPPSIWACIYKKDLLIKNKIKFLKTPGASYQDTSFFLKTLFKSKKVIYINDSFLNYRQTNFNSSINNNSIEKVMFVHKEYSEFEKYIKTDINSFNKIEKFYNTKKVYSLFWNLERVDKKKKYIKLIYQNIYKILKNKNYLANQFNKKEKNFLNFLQDYGYEITYEIYKNTLNYNKTNPKISIIILFYNSEKFISECLNSLINQTFKNFEIICVNDGSTDNSSKIIKEFEKKDERVRLIDKNDKDLEKNRNIEIKESKGDYLIFLNSNDVFDNSMIEELFAKIKGNDDEIVICNSNEFKNENGTIIITKKKYFNFDNNLKKKTFSFFDIKKDFFYFLFFFPFDKIFKKKFIEDLKNKIQNLYYLDDLNFIASIVFEANKISILDKNLINHRIGKNIKFPLNKINFENFCVSLQNLKKKIKQKDLYKRFKQDFINYIATYSIWQLENINGESFCFLFQKLKNEFWNTFGITKYDKNYFYDKNIYNKIKNILDSNLDVFEVANQLKNKDKKINYLKKQKISCLHKIFFSSSKKYLSNSFQKILKNFLVIFFFIINYINIKNR